MKSSRPWRMHQALPMTVQRHVALISLICTRGCDLPFCSTPLLSCFSPVSFWLFCRCTSLHVIYGATEVYCTVYCFTVGQISWGSWWVCQNEQRLRWGTCMRNMPSCIVRRRKSRGSCSQRSFFNLYFPNLHLSVNWRRIGSYWNSRSIVSVNLL